MSSGPAFIDVFLPGENIWIPLEKTWTFFGATRYILLSRNVPLVKTKFHFSLPPFYYEGSALSGQVNGVFLLPFYTELHACSSVPTTVRYVLGDVHRIPFPM